MLPGAAFFTMLSGLADGELFIIAIASPASSDDASFAAASGTPAVTIAAIASVSTSFSAHSGEPTATITPKSVTPPNNASFAAHAGEPTTYINPVTIRPGLAVFHVRSGTPTVFIDKGFRDASFIVDSGEGAYVEIIAESVRERDPAAEAKAHQVEGIRTTTSAGAVRTTTSADTVYTRITA